MCFNAFYRRKNVRKTSSRNMKTLSIVCIVILYQCFLLQAEAKKLPISRPLPFPSCKACLCRNCGINGRCVADNNRCLEACDLRCRKEILCKRNPCQLKGNQCKGNEICTPKCGSCSEVKCLAAWKPNNPCQNNGNCQKDEKCVVLGCNSRKCVPKHNTCDPCSKIKCKKGYKCVSNKNSCTARCERDCLFCRNKNLCEQKTCGKNKYCLTTCHSCQQTCRSISICRRNPCSGGLCSSDEKCIPNFKTCTHSCEKCDKLCATIYKPVCGTDGNTYSNQCFLNVAICKSKRTLRKKHNGKCKCKDQCPLIKCGFGARCLFDPKTCTSQCDCPLRKCTLNYDPICGTDGKTYRNRCFLSGVECKTQGKITEKHKGACQKVCPNKCLHVKCDLSRECFMDDKTCLPKCLPICNPTCASVKCAYGKCVQDPITCKVKCDCKRICTEEYQPICGSDKKAYSNKCMFEIGVCESRGKLTKLHDGECKKECKDQCPVIKCGFGARCLFDPKTCTSKCNCQRPCTKEYQPICGSDKKTYSNKCTFAIGVCKSRGKLTKLHDGECKKEICPFHNPCSGIICAKDKRCVPDFSKCAYSCQPKVCPILNCVQPACDAKPCGKDEECLSICKNSCVHACQKKRKVCQKDLCKALEGTCNKKIGEICEINKIKCTARCVCPSLCPSIFDPVCGSDGITYGNNCQLTVKTCTTGGKITKIRDGPCLTKG